MATINLGAIKFNWKGAYNSGTSYAVDDVVSSGGNSYVCIQAHSNQAVGNATAYWNIMATKGTNGTDGTDGTDVGATLSNKEIAFKTNAGAVDGIPIGTAGQFLKVNSGATGYEYGAVSSDFVKVASGTHNGATDLIIDNLDTTTYSKFRLVLDNVIGTTGDTDTLYLQYRYNNSGSQATYSGSDYTYRIFGKFSYGGTGDTGESSGGNLDTKIRTNWAMSKYTNARYTQSLILEFTNLESVTQHKDCAIFSFGTYYNGTEYTQYNFGVGQCRNGKAMNGFKFYGAYTWTANYTVYGMK